MLFFQLILLGFSSVSALVSNLLPPATTYSISQNSTMSANEPIYNARLERPVRAFRKSKLSG